MKYLAITAVLCLVLAGASFAGNVVMTEVLTGGNLTLTMPDNFSLTEVTLGGSSSFTASSGNPGVPYYYVEDSRGTGPGWNLGFSISQFTTGGTNARTIPVANYEQKAHDSYVSCVYGQAQVGPSGGPLASHIGTNVQSTEVKTYYSNAGYGMGKYRLGSGSYLTVPAETYAGTYTATLTATLNAVP